MEILATNKATWGEWYVTNTSQLEWDEDLKIIVFLCSNVGAMQGVTSWGQGLAGGAAATQQMTGAQSAAAAAAGAIQQPSAAGLMAAAAAYPMQQFQVV